MLRTSCSWRSAGSGVFRALICSLCSSSFFVVLLILYLTVNSDYWRWFWLCKLFWSCTCEMSHDVLSCFSGTRLWHVCYFHKFDPFRLNFQSDPIWLADKFCYCWLLICNLLFRKIVEMFYRLLEKNFFVLRFLKLTCEK